MELHCGMSFEWDHATRPRNLAKHGIDFLLARNLFDRRPVVTVRSSFPEEERFLTTGVFEGCFITVIWARRSGAIRIISARRARNAESSKERSYRALYGGRA